MSAELVIHPGRQYADAAEFRTSHPPYSIGLEVVNAPPKFTQTSDGPYLIIDHHTGVERRVTDSACKQAWNAVNLGLIDTFTRDGEYHPRIVIRDCDQDVNLAAHIIARAEHVGEMPDEQLDRVEELVRVEDIMDRFGGVPPGRITRHKRNVLERIAWIFDAYTNYRASGAIYQHDAEGHRNVMWEGSRRISLHAAGEGESRSLDTRYRPLGSERHVHVAERVGAEALLGAAGDGLHAVIMHEQRPDGGNQYTFFRRSELVPFDLLRLYATLNAIEGCAPGQGHGGSDTIGGSPLLNGSTITPGEMVRILAQNPHILTHPTPAANS